MIDDTSELDPDIVEVLRRAEPYPAAPVNVQSRVRSAVMLRIAERLPSTAHQRSAAPAWAVAALASAILAGVLAFRLGRSPIAAKPPDDPDVLMLPDGSRGVLERASRISIAAAAPNHILLLLEEGGIQLEVPRSEGRTFVVRAAGYEAEVLGTAFRVRINASGGRKVLEVGVTHGRVKVTPPDHSDAQILGPGETWMEAIEPTPASRILPVASSGEVAASRPLDERRAAGIITQVSPPAETPSSPSVRAPTSVPRAAGESAKDLLARAMEARAAGRLTDAAALLDNLRKRHRGDSRAGLAAFELGRLRLDALGDTAGAIEAFHDAMVLGPNAPFREDAEARRVEALDAAGDPRCSGAQAAYLARYPVGLHARAVAARCVRR
jgi:hypothetical protein